MYGDTARSRPKDPMPALLTISGSPFPNSRTEGAALVIERAVEASGAGTGRLAVRDLPPAALIGANVKDPAVAAALASIAAADAVLIATPVYKAAYTGVLKVLLDLAPADILAGTPVASVLSGGSPDHGPLAVTALGALLDALGGSDRHAPVFALDRALERTDVPGEVTVTDERTARELDAAAAWLAERLGTGA